MIDKERIYRECQRGYLDATRDGGDSTAIKLSRAFACMRETLEGANISHAEGEAFIEAIASAIRTYAPTSQREELVRILYLAFANVPYDGKLEIVDVNFLKHVKF